MKREFSHCRLPLSATEVCYVVADSTVVFVAIASAPSRVLLRGSSETRFQRRERRRIAGLNQLVGKIAEKTAAKLIRLIT